MTEKLNLIHVHQQKDSMSSHENHPMRPKRIVTQMHHVHHASNPTEDNTEPCDHQEDAAEKWFNISAHERAGFGGGFGRMLSSSELSQIVHPH